MTKLDGRLELMMTNAWTGCIPMTRNLHMRTTSVDLPVIMLSVQAHQLIETNKHLYAILFVDQICSYFSSNHMQNH